MATAESREKQKYGKSTAGVEKGKEKNTAIAGEREKKDSSWSTRRAKYRSSREKSKTGVGAEMRER